MFRLISARKVTHDQVFKTQEIGGKAPFKSVIVGGNATGKTRFIVSMIEAFRLLSEHKDPYRKNSKSKKRNLIADAMEFSYYMNGDLVDCIIDELGVVHLTVDGEEALIHDTPLPTCVLAISSTVNDKFPFSDSDEDEFYHYCGVRETSNASWTATLSRRTIENLLNIPLRNHQNSIQELFSYLGISTSLNVEFKVNKVKQFQELVENPTLIMEAVNEYAQKISRMQVEMFRNFSLENARRACYGLCMSNITGRNNSISFDLSDTNAEYSDVYYAINVFRRIGVIADVDLRVIKLDSGESYGFSNSSSGEAQLLYTFSSLIRHAKNNCLIFIDEPELSLHPTWQIKYISLLKRALASFPGCHIIMATHSHFIISDLDSESSSLHIFEKKGTALHIRNVEYSTYAWSADNILYDVFDVRNVGNLAFENDLAEALSLIAQKTSDTQRLHQLKEKFERLTFNESDPLKKVISSIAEFVDAAH
ncbi:ATPase_AAA_core domain-containing protein [Pseudomonas chlororaphis]